MIFNKHLEMKDNDKHAFLSPSQYHWLNYDDEKLANVYKNRLATEKGTELHEFAATCIKLKQKLPRTRSTLNMYVNDAIAFDMVPEQFLYFSKYCFGTADAISFSHNKLRIHDLKTGLIPAHIEQLEIYAALFCLEYGKRPGSIEMELRIYQNDEAFIFIPTAEDIAPIIDRIIRSTKILSMIDRQTGNEEDVSNFDINNLFDEEIEK